MYVYPIPSGSHQLFESIRMDFMTDPPRQMDMTQLWSRWTMALVKEQYSPLVTKKVSLQNTPYSSLSITFILILDYLTKLSLIEKPNSKLEVCKLLGIKSAMMTTFHLQVNEGTQVSIFQADIDPIDQLETSTEPESSSTIQVVPLPAISMQSNNIVERTKHAIEQHWGSHQDNHRDEDEDDRDKDNKDKDNKYEDKEDKEDEDKDDEDKDENERPGLSAWDLLGKAFEQEAATLGLSCACESLTQLKIL